MLAQRYHYHASHTHSLNFFAAMKIFLSGVSCEHTVGWWWTDHHTKVRKNIRANYPVDTRIKSGYGLGDTRYPPALSVVKFVYPIFTRFIKVETAYYLLPTWIILAMKSRTRYPPECPNNSGRHPWHETRQSSRAKNDWILNFEYV
jgi:hypothetical protein